MANILVVDDEVGIRELLSEVLGEEGHVVTVAENAQQARTFRQNNVPNLVLLDIWMPNVDGMMLLREWRYNGLLTMPVIMMSGHATINTAVEATRIGALNFLEKPISFQRLLRAVQQGLKRNFKVNQVKEFCTRSIDAPNGLNSTAFSSTAKNLVESEVSNNMPAVIPENLFSSSFSLPLREARDIFERAYFEYHLVRESGSMTRVAEKTGLERTHLYRKLKQLGINPGKLSKKNGQSRYSSK
jgi:DNA-binding NtrC family response regulator